MPLQDQGAIIRSGMAIVPDYAQQLYDQQQMDLQKSQHGLAQQQFAVKQQQQQREQARAASFDQDVQGYLADPTPKALISLMAKYPEQSESLKRAYEAQTGETQAGDMRQAGEIYGLAQNGRYDLAAEKLRTTIEAEKRAGAPEDPADMQVLAMLDSGDPLLQKKAMGIIGMQLAVASGDKFASVYGELNPKLSPKMKEYEDRVAKFGKKAADEWLAVQDTKLVPVQQGGSIFSASDLLNQRKGGGDPASTQGLVGDGSTPDMGDFTGRLSEIMKITADSESGNRDFNKSGGILTSKVGAKGRMQVLDGTNSDPGFGVRPAQNNSVEERARVGRDYLEAMLKRYKDPAKAWAAYNAGPGRLDEALAKGGSWLAKMPKETRDYVAKNMRALGKGGGRPVQVRSKQAYERLAPGTQYVAPDGSMRVKS